MLVLWAFVLGGGGGSVGGCEYVFSLGEGVDVYMHIHIYHPFHSNLPFSPFIFNFYS